MPINVIELASLDEISNAAASLIARQVRDKPSALLGLATGRTPIPIYHRLSQMYETGKLSFRNTVTYNLDEYVGLSASHPASFASYMQRTFFLRTDINQNNINLVDGAASCAAAEATRYECQLTGYGPIDLQLLGIGQNGHIGFNEPGSPHDSRTRVVELCPSTLEANKEDIGNLEIVPSHAISMGIATILEAKAILVVATGRAKSAAVARMLNGPISIDLPASALRKHPNVTVLADAPALAKVK